jgi:hypothetical protein
MACYKQVVGGSNGTKRDLNLGSQQKSNHIYDFIGVWSLSAAYAAIYLNLELWGVGAPAWTNHPEPRAEKLCPSCFKRQSAAWSGLAELSARDLLGGSQGARGEGLCQPNFSHFRFQRAKLRENIHLPCVFFTQIKPRLGSPLHPSSPTSGQSLEELVAAWRSHPS